MLPGYAFVLAEAWSCLAALADAAESPDLSAAYEWLLLDLDVLTDDAGPATYSILCVEFDELVGRAERALDNLRTFGVDALSLELLIERLRGCAPGPQPS